MDIRVSSRFWSSTFRLPEFATSSILQLKFHKILPLRDEQTHRQFYASTSDKVLSSRDRLMRYLPKVFGEIQSNHNLSDLLERRLAEGEVWICSFGEGINLENMISEKLLKQIKSSHMSLFYENYPLSEDANPEGRFLVRRREVHEAELGRHLEYYLGNS